MNRPSVRSEGTNISNEPVTNTNPAIFQNSRLLLNGHGIYSVQEVASSIYQVPQCTNTSFSQTNTSSSATLMAIPLYYPGGVTFTFQQPPPCPHPNGIQTSQYVQQPLQQQQLQQQQRQQILPSYNGQQLSQIDYCTLLKQLEQHIMEKMVVQSQQQCKPYQLRFHCNAGTSTSGLSYPCQENYKTTQTETQRSKRRECGCDCQPQLCLHIETSTTTSPIEPDDQNQSIESSTKTELQECSLKCIQDNKPNSKCNKNN